MCSSDLLWRIIGAFDGKVKIIRNESIGERNWFYVMEPNVWKNSGLYKALNTTYYNGIDATYKNMIENATWRTGGWVSNRITTAQMYEYEGSAKGGGESSLLTTIGYIGLMSASDYGYASSACYESKTLVQYEQSICESTNWLKKNSEWTEWTITAAGNSFSDTSAYAIGAPGYVFSTYVTSEMDVRPSLYLKSTVYITGGTGTSGDPYILGT